MTASPLNISDPSADIEVKLLRTAAVEDMIALYKDAGWWKDVYDDSHSFLEKIPKDSALFAGAFAGKKMIGMGRALSDRSSDAYIQDIVVLKSYRGRGLGQLIVRKLIRGLKEMGVDWIGLIAEPGTNLFYEKLGFREMKGYVPFKLEEEQ
jgi:spermidine synthase